jgi:hypothetical protein
MARAHHTLVRSVPGQHKAYSQRLGDIMLLGYMCVSKADGSQPVDLQRDARLSAGVAPAQIDEDRASGRLDARPGLEALLKALRAGETRVVWTLDRLSRDLRHLVNTVHDLTPRGIGCKVLTSHGASINTTTSAGKLVFGIFAALAEFERALIAERTKAGLASARAGPHGRSALQDDCRQRTARHDGYGTIRHEHWRSLPGMGRDPPNPVPTCGT